MVGTAPNSSTRKEVFNENDYNSVKQGLQGYGIISGGAQTVSGTNMSVSFGYCYYRWGGQDLYIGGLYQTFTSTTKDRQAIIGINNGYWTLSWGTPEDPNSTTDNYFERYTPAPPSLTSGSIPVAQIYIPANATVLTSDMVKDMRIMINASPPLPMPLSPEGAVLTVTGGVPTWSASSAGSSIPTKMVIDFTKDDLHKANVGRYAGDNYLKVRHAMLFDESQDLGFIKLYDMRDPNNPTELIWGHDWDNLTDYDLKQGTVKDLTDTLRILTIVENYRLVYTENVIPYTPKIMTWIKRDATLKPKRCIPYRINVQGVGLSEVDAIQQAHGTSFFEYLIRAGGVDLTWSFPDSAGIAGFVKGSPIQMDIGGTVASMRIEAYSHGKTHSQSRVALNPSMDSTMVPQEYFTTNAMDLETMPFMTPNGRPRGNFYFRLRDTKTNTVTNFAQQRLHLKKCGMRSFRDQSLIGTYNRVSLI